MVRKIMALLGILMIGAVVYSAYDVYSARNDPNKCLVADQIHFKSRSKNGLAVYKRVSGMHDKVVYYELYDDDVKFDFCGRADLESLSGASVDENLGHLAQVVVKEKKITLEYGSKDSAPAKVVWY